MARFSEGETVWAKDPLSPSGGVGAFEVLDVFEDPDDEDVDWLLLAPPDDQENPFCVPERRAFRTKEEAERMTKDGKG